MNDDALMAQLRALRATLASAVQQIDAMVVRASVSDGPCPHPEKRRVDMSSMGERRFSCKDCGALVEMETA